MRELMLSNGQITQVSNEDLMFLLGISGTWHLDHWGYVVFWGRNNGRNCSYYMHKEIAKRMGLNISNKVDHEDKDKLNNQRDNLREATNSENQTNSGAHIDNKLGNKNIYQDPKTGKFIVDIRKLGNRFTRYCDTLDEAIEIRNKILIKMHGDYASFD